MLFKAFATMIALTAAQLMGATHVSLSSSSTRATGVTTHGMTVMMGTDYLLGPTPGSSAGVTFSTDDLPEAKNMTVVADLMQTPTLKQMRALGTRSPLRKIKVACDSVDVAVWRDSKTGRSVSAGHGKDCKLDSIVE